MTDHAQLNASPLFSTMSGQVILISGANRGIGRAVAERCARLGARLAIGARTPCDHERVAAELSELGAEAIGVTLDVTDDASVESAVQTVISHWGQIDGFVSCAGVIQYDTPVWETSIEDWDHLMSVNVRGTFLCCHHVAPHMVKRGSGRIVNIASSSARMADEDLGAYTASKWAVAGYTTSLARSMRSHGVRVNGVNPGWVDTDMSRAYQPEGDDAWSTADEIARAVCYLLTDAPRDMTGQFIDIFGS